MTNTPIELLDESSRWHARNVRYVAGNIESILGELPEFELRPFQSDVDAPANPFLKVVMRLPRTRLERPMPVGVVSNNTPSPDIGSWPTSACKRFATKASPLLHCAQNWASLNSVSG